MTDTLPLSSQPGTRVARRLLPAALFLPVLIGWVRLEGQRAGLYGTEVGLALFAMVNAACFTALILWTAVWLNRADAARSRAATKLRESEDRFRSLADALPQIVWATGADGSARYLNSRWSEYTGLPDAGPDASAQVIHPDDRRAMNDDWEKALRSETTEFQHEFRLRSAGTGGYRWFLARAVPVRGPAGEVREWLGTSTDIDDLKRTEEALRQSQRHFRELAESLPQLVWTDRPDGYCDYLSPQWERYTGIPAAEQLGYGWVDQVHPDDRERVGAAWAATVAAGTDFEIEFRIRRADGAHRWFQTRAAPLRDEAGAVVKWFGTNTDIDDMKRTEAALARSHEMLQLVLDTVPQGVFWKDRESRFLGCNRVVARAMGLADPAEIAGKGHADLLSITPAEVEQFVRIDREVMVADAPRLHIVEPMTLADGRTIWLDTNKVPLHDESGRVVGVLGTWEDITDRLRAEAELKEKEARLHAADRRLAKLVTGMSEGCYLLDADWRFTFVNDRCESLFHRRRDEMLGRTVWEAFPRLPGTPMEADFRRVMADQVPFSFVAFSPTVGRWLDVRLFPTGDGLAAFLLDIHDRRLAEERVQTLNAELEDRVAERTAQLKTANKELEAFSYSVSHDLRAPLRAIDGFSRIVMQDFGPHLPAEAQEYLTDIRANTKKMGQLVDDLLAFSRLGRKPLTRQPVPTAELVAGCLAELRPLRAGRQVDIRVGDLADCNADPALLKQVWLNLLSNALKYSGKRDTAIIEVSCTSGPDGPTYSVRDNGVGFDMRYAHKLFGVFQRLHRAEEYEGTGVGLAIVQRVVHRHGGRVWAEAEPDRGATFFFTLPPAGPADGGSQHG